MRSRCPQQSASRNPFSSFNSVVRPTSAVGHAGQHAQHLEQQPGRQQGSIAAAVVGRGHLDQVAADEVEAAAGTDDLQGLDGREPARLRRAGARGARGIQPVDVEAQVDRSLADQCPER